jgi:hypothetical protein
MSTYLLIAHFFFANGATIQYMIPAELTFAQCSIAAMNGQQLNASAVEELKDKIVYTVTYTCMVEPK